MALPFLIPLGVAAISGAITSIIVGNQQARATENAAKTVSDASKDSQKLQREIYEDQRDNYNRIYDQQRQDAMPWHQAGVNALNELSGMEMRPFGMEDFQADPGYAFRLAEGMKAFDAMGGRTSGNAIRAAQQYAQGLASQEYQNAFNRYQTDRNARLGHLQTLAGYGQNATGQMGQAGQYYGAQMGQAGQNYAAGTSDAMMTGANALAQGMIGAQGARSSGYLGAMNTLNQGLGMMGNYYQGSQVLNSLNRQSVL